MQTVPVRAGTPQAMSLKAGQTAAVFMCETDWQHHLLSDGAGTKVYPTPVSFARHRTCTNPNHDRSCRLLEVDVSVRSFVPVEQLSAAYETAASHPRPARRSGIYVASKVRHAPYWQQLRDAGLPIISSWIDDEVVADQVADMADLWYRCIKESSVASVLLCVLEEGDAAKGVLSEIGSALASGNPVHYVGPERAYTVLAHEGVRRFATVDEALEAAGFPVPEAAQVWHPATEMPSADASVWGLFYAQERDHDAAGSRALALRHGAIGMSTTEAGAGLLAWSRGLASDRPAMPPVLPALFAPAGQWVRMRDPQSGYEMVVRRDQETGAWADSSGRPLGEADAGRLHIVLRTGDTVGLF